MNIQKLCNARMIGTLLAMMTISLTGCASRSPISQLQPQDEISFHAVEPLERTKNTTVSNEEVGRTTGEYAGAGAYAGAAAGLSCGPLFLLCSPLGMIVGGVMGGSAGLVVGAASGLDAEASKTIEEKLKKALEENPITENLLGELKDRSQTIFSVTENSELNRLHFQLIGIELDSYDEGISLIITVSAALSYLNEDQERITKSDIFRYDSTPINAYSWVSADDEFFRGLFASANHYITQQVVFNLIDDRQ